MKKGYHPVIDAIEKCERGVTIPELFKLAKVLDVDPGLLMMQTKIPDDRILFLQTFIKYLAVKDQPMHLTAIRNLVEDAMKKRIDG
ncbi:MAG: hypothetical protein NTV82_02335 [Candidatus Aminicenantes bacterium]|nr:hypothetical protein [Candidatus Aminicenantes bacterium]